MAAAASSLGGTTTTLAGGDHTVPARYWNVLVVLPAGSDDLSRVSATTRVIAVDMPNTQAASALPWGSYRTSVDALEDSKAGLPLSGARQRAGGGGGGGG